MRSQNKFVCFIILTFCFYFASIEIKSKSDTPSVITDGGVTLSGSLNPNGLFRFEGNGFLLNGSLADGSVSTIGCCLRPGQMLSLNSRFIGSSSIRHGSAVINGVNYSELFYEGTVQFNTKGIILPFASSVWQVFIVTPFSFTATLQGCTTNPVNGCPQGYVFERTFKGQGTATLHLKAAKSIGYRQYSFNSITYTFQE